MDEPRPGLKRGHIPGAKNVPWGDLVTEGELKTTDELAAIFRRRVWICISRLSPVAVQASLRRWLFSR